MPKAISHPIPTSDTLVSIGFVQGKHVCGQMVREMTDSIDVEAVFSGMRVARMLDALAKEIYALKREPNS